VRENISLVLEVQILLLIKVNVMANVSVKEQNASPLIRAATFFRLYYSMHFHKVVGYSRL
jgi:hypothetical protein